MWGRPAISCAVLEVHSIQVNYEFHFTTVLFPFLSQFYGAICFYYFHIKVCHISHSSTLNEEIGQEQPM